MQPNRTRDRSNPWLFSLRCWHRRPSPDVVAIIPHPRSIEHGPKAWAPTRIRTRRRRHNFCAPRRPLPVPSLPNKTAVYHTPIPALPNRSSNGRRCSRTIIHARRRVPMTIDPFPFSNGGKPLPIPILPTRFSVRPCGRRWAQRWGIRRLLIIAIHPYPLSTTVLPLPMSTYPHRMNFGFRGMLYTLRRHWRPHANRG